MQAAGAPESRSQGPKRKVKTERLTEGPRRYDSPGSRFVLCLLTRCHAAKSLLSVHSGLRWILLGEGGKGERGGEADKSGFKKRNFSALDPRLLGSLVPSFFPSDSLFFTNFPSVESSSVSISTSCQVFQLCTGGSLARPLSLCLPRLFSPSPLPLTAILLTPSFHVPVSPSVSGPFFPFVMSR